MWKLRTCKTMAHVRADLSLCTPVLSVLTHNNNNPEQQRRRRRIGDVPHLWHRPLRVLHLPDECPRVTRWPRQCRGGCLDLMPNPLPFTADQPVNNPHRHCICVRSTYVSSATGTAPLTLTRPWRPTHPEPSQHRVRRWGALPTAGDVLRQGKVEGGGRVDGATNQAPAHSSGNDRHHF
jgi:hypothetical protein